MTVQVTPLGNVPIELIIIKDRFRVDRGEIELMAESLKAHGQIHPVAVTKDMRLLAGERRILAAQSLGWETVRAEMHDHLDAIGEKEVELDENQMRKGFTWPEVAKLEKAIFEMKSAKDPKWSHRKQEDLRGVSKSLVGMRMQLAEAIELIPELAEFETQDEAWKMYKKLEENITVGQLHAKAPQVRNAPGWAETSYVVRDSLDGMAQMADASFDFAEVDPPYAIELDRRKSRNVDEGHTETYEEISAEAFPAFMKGVIGQTFRLLKPNTFGVFWYGMQWHHEMYIWLRQAGFAVNPVPAIWYKGDVGQTAQPDVALGSCYEPFWLARKGTPKLKRQGRGNVFYYNSVSPAKKIHSTEKPIELLSDILATVLFPGSNILVPFLGSGVTLRAANKLGHVGLGFDRSQAHKERFLDRVADEHPTADLDEVDNDDDAATAV